MLIAGVLPLFTIKAQHILVTRLDQKFTSKICYDSNTSDASQTLIIMAAPVLATKLFVPPLRRNLVMRQRLIDQLNTGVQQKLTLISAPAGFGKTTLVSEWTTICGQQVAWLSLDEGDNDPTRFLT